MEINKSLTTRIWDKIGVCASGICLIHCLATPILLLIFPASKIQVFEHGVFHAVFAVLVVGSILLAVYPTCKKHGHKDIMTFAALGVFFILSSFLFHDYGEAIEYLFTIAGSICLIIAHIRNMKVRHGKCESTKSSCSGH
jgi:hypothetical protein